MILEGRKYDITIFGIGDHNHNLDIKKWKQQLKEAEDLRKKYPSFLIYNNCEITFLVGHFLVLEPGLITGTIQEGYKFLYNNHDIIKIINHPNPATDEWHKRIIPSVSAIEVVNGAVFREAKRAGYRFTSAMDIPLIQMYAKYLSLDYPVAAIGNSDAHELADMGSGMTGLWLQDPPDNAGVLQAVRDRRAFATTDPGICIRCELDQQRGEYSWEVEWNPVNPAAAKKFRVEVYNRDKKLDTTDGSGQIDAQEEGLYWVAAFNDEAIEVSSPLYKYDEKEKSDSSRKKIIKADDLVKMSLKDMQWLSLHEKASLDLSTLRREGAAEIELLSSKSSPEIIDADGNRVGYKVVNPGKERIVIDKRCDPPCFDEFFLWLERNEIHECMFWEIDYKKINDLFIFDGILVPAKMVFRKGFCNRYRKELSRIKGLITPKTKFRLYVRTLFKMTIQINLDDHPFPMKIENHNNTNLNSLLLFIDQDVDYPEFSQFINTESMDNTEYDNKQKIYQVFL